MNNRLKSNDDTLTYYSGTNQLKTAYADSFAYNGDGAAVLVGGDVYEYNWKNRLEHIDVNDGYIDHDFFYDYDFQGLRVRKEEKTVDEVFGLRGKPVTDIRYNYTYYFYDAAGRLLCEFDKNGNLSRKFVYLPSAIIQISGSDTSYLHLDNLGSPAVVTDNSGNVQKQYRYYAFGELRSQSGSFNTDYSFTGYLKEETGNHYAKMRYYEGGIGRFLRVDPLGALNPYVYCGNDPLNFVDPWGLVGVYIGSGTNEDPYETDIVIWGMEVKAKRTVGPWANVDNYHPFDDCLQITLTDDICRQEEGEFYGLPAKNRRFPIEVKGGTVGKKGGNRPPGKKPDQPNTPPASYFEGQIWINIGKFFGVTFGYIYSPSQGEFWYVGPTGGVSLWPIGTSVHEGYSDVVEGLNIQLQGGAGLSGQGGWGVFKGRKGFYKESGATYNPNAGLNVVWIWGGY